MLIQHEITRYYLGCNCYACMICVKWKRKHRQKNVIFSITHHYFVTNSHINISKLRKHVLSFPCIWPKTLEMVNVCCTGGGGGGYNQQDTLTVTVCVITCIENSFLTDGWSIHSHVHNGHSTTSQIKFDEWMNEWIMSLQDLPGGGGEEGTR